MNENVFVDTKRQSPECSFISIEDWNKLLRLKCYKFFLWQEFFICNKMLSIAQECLPTEGILGIFSVKRMTGSCEWIFPLHELFL